MTSWWFGNACLLHCMLDLRVLARTGFGFQLMQATSYHEVTLHDGAAMAANTLAQEISFVEERIQGMHSLLSYVERRRCFMRTFTVLDDMLLDRGPTPATPSTTSPVSPWSGVFASQRAELSYLPSLHAGRAQITERD